MGKPCRLFRRYGLFRLCACAFARPAVNHHEKDRWAKAAAALDRVNLSAYAELPTTRLTYGQRVASAA